MPLSSFSAISGCILHTRKGFWGMLKGDSNREEIPEVAQMSL
ncbi:hypothetical protein LEMLEM_LOCUS27684 [Lemmus lemmus]